MTRPALLMIMSFDAFAFGIHTDILHGTLLLLVKGVMWTLWGGWDADNSTSISPFSLYFHCVLMYVFVKYIFMLAMSIWKLRDCSRYIWLWRWKLMWWDKEELGTYYRATFHKQAISDTLHIFIQPHHPWHVDVTTVSLRLVDMQYDAIIHLFPINFGQSACNSVKVQPIPTLRLPNHAQPAAELPNRRNCLHCFRNACTVA